MRKYTQSTKQLELFPQKFVVNSSKAKGTEMVDQTLSPLEVLELKKTLEQSYSFQDIEEGIVDYYKFLYAGFKIDMPIFSTLSKYHGILNVYSVISLFESFIDNKTKNECGVVFTPRYIADFIVREVADSITTWSKIISIIDPSCGCGTFLVSAIEYIHNKYNISISDIVRNNIFGIDCISDNVRRCKLIIKLLCIIHGEDYPEPNILCEDALSSNWCHLFNKGEFELIIGNPPYVNPHDLPKSVTDFLRSSFMTTNSGTFNIYYAFIELSLKHLSSTGLIGYIIPNNMLRIKSASNLRKYLSSLRAVRKIIDFKDNMIFAPIRSYNCIMFLSKSENQELHYSTIDKTNDIQRELRELSCLTLDTIHMDDKQGWNLLDSDTLLNLKKIESQYYRLKFDIHTGIATLRDSVYIVERDEYGYYKLISNRKMYVDKELVVDLYKIPDLKTSEKLSDVIKYIICPYMMVDGKRQLISEDILRAKYSNTYHVLSLYKNELAQRDGGKAKDTPWFAYGRSQGLNGFQKKLLFPTFSYKPRFILVENSTALFCNGYAIFQSEYPFDILERVVNSEVMDYYVRQTSYQIEGGYYCYQKKYIERFSLPLFSKEEIDYIRSSSQNELNSFLLKKYDLDVNC